MKTMKVFGLTAVAVLCLGLAHAGADPVSAKAAAPSHRGHETAAVAAPGHISEGGAPMSTAGSARQMDGVSVEFLQAIRHTTARDNGPVYGIQCVESYGRICCYDWLVGWICAPIEG